VYCYVENSVLTSSVGGWVQAQPPKSFIYWKSGQNSWKSVQNLKIRAKWRPIMLDFIKWRPTFAEKHMKTFFGDHPKRSSWSLRENICWRSRQRLLGQVWENLGKNPSHQPCISVFEKSWKTTLGNQISTTRETNRHRTWWRNCARWKCMPMYTDEWIKFNWRNLVWLSSSSSLLSFHMTQLLNRNKTDDNCAIIGVVL